MKQQISRNIAFVLVGVAFSSLAFGQSNSATAAVSADVLIPITIEKTRDMVFGNIVPGNGIVTLSTSGDRTKTGAGVGFSNSGTPPQSAEFVVKGSAGKGGYNKFSIAYSGTSSSLSGPGGSTMPIEFFTAVKGAEATGLIPSAAFDADDGGVATAASVTIQAGAKLTVKDNQTPGSYTGSLVLVVAYN